MMAGKLSGYIPNTMDKSLEDFLKSMQCSNQGWCWFWAKYHSFTLNWNCPLLLCTCLEHISKVPVWPTFWTSDEWVTHTHTHMHTLQKSIKEKCGLWKKQMQIIVWAKLHFTNFFIPIHCSPPLKISHGFLVQELL